MAERYCNRIDINRQIENCLVGLAMLEELPEYKWVRRLDNWGNVAAYSKGADDCGSAFCFGGWVAQTPHFNKQGVFPFSQKELSPAMKKHSPYISAWEIPRYLFGDSLIFNSYGDSEKGPARKVVRQRLNKALDNLLDRQQRL